jgi:aldehyde:ferredoxin oxidoreductase
MLNLERAFNLREGFGRKDDRLPDRIINEPPKRGPVSEQTYEMDYMLDDYYVAQGWEKTTGNPTRERLENIGLKTVADDLEKLGKLA